MMEERKQEESIFDNDSLNETNTALLKISRWTRIMSSIGFGIGAFVVIAMLTSGAQTLKTIAASLPIASNTYTYPALVILFFILFFIAALVLYYLYKSSRLIAQGVLQKSTESLSQAFVYLKNFFIVVIIFAAIQLAGNIFSLL